MLLGADYTECDYVMELPGSTPELLGTVRTHTNDAGSVKGMAPREGTDGN